MSRSNTEEESTLDKVLPWIGVPARLLVGIVWIAAGALKVTDLNQSIHAVQAYQILPSGLAEAVGIVLPLIELAIGALLVVGLATMPAAVISGLLFIAFIIGISSAWARGLQIDCGCFGSGGQLADGVDPNYFWEIMRDVGLLLCSALLMWRPRTKFSVDGLLFKTK